MNYIKVLEHSDKLIIDDVEYTVNFTDYEKGIVQLLFDYKDILKRRQLEAINDLKENKE